MAKRLLAGHSLGASVLREDCARHLFGRLPGRGDRDTSG